MLLAGMYVAQRVWGCVLETDVSCWDLLNVDFDISMGFVGSTIFLLILCLKTSHVVDVLQSCMLGE